MTKKLHKKSFSHYNTSRLVLISVIFVSILVGVFYVNKSSSLVSKATLDTYPVQAVIDSPAGNRPISPYVWGVNSMGIRSKSTEWNAADIEMVDKNAVKWLGIKSIRYPGGCYGDAFNWRTSISEWKDPTGKLMSRRHTSVADMYRLATGLGAELIYQVNISSVNKGNPCGFLSTYPGKGETENLSILLNDAKEIVSSYKGKIKIYELGNEQWGSWTPQEYQTVATRFAQAMKQVDPSIRLGLVGFPSQVNNVDESFPATENDSRWTTVIKNMVNIKCGTALCFDYVTDHPYSKAGYDPKAQNLAPTNFPGISAFFPLVNYDRLIFDKRISDYSPRQVSTSEWNLKNWVNNSSKSLPINNYSFENQSAIWPYWSLTSPSHGNFSITTDEHSDGIRSVKAVLTNYKNEKQSHLIKGIINQKVQPNHKVQVTLSVKSNQPQYTYIAFQQRNDGPHKYQYIQQTFYLKTIRPNEWQNVKLSATLYSDTTEIQVVLGQNKTSSDWSTKPDNVVTYFDNVRVDDITNYDPMVASVGTVEHGMFTGETLALMGVKQMFSSSYHHFAFDTSPIGLMQASGTFSAAGQAFAITSKLAGMNALTTRTQSSELFTTPENPCKKLMCLKGGVSVPYVSMYAANSAKELAVLIFNRHQSKGASVNFSADTFKHLNLSNASIKTLSASSYTDTSFQETQSTHNLKTPITVPPISITRIIVSAPTSVPAPTTPIPTPKITQSTSMPTALPSTTSQIATKKTEPLDMVSATPTTTSEQNRPDQLINSQNLPSPSPSAIESSKNETLLMIINRIIRYVFDVMREIMSFSGNLV